MFRRHIASQEDKAELAKARDEEAAERLGTSVPEHPAEQNED